MWLVDQRGVSVGEGKQRPLGNCVVEEVRPVSVLTKSEGMAHLSQVVIIMSRTIGPS